MNEFITIVEKTSIDVLPEYVAWITVGIASGLILIPTILAWIFSRGQLHKILITEFISGILTIVLCFIFVGCFSHRFVVPTGEYKYKVIVDKNNITVSEYEEFLEKYKPEIRDGYYYFEYGVMEE